FRRVLFRSFSGDVPQGQLAQLMRGDNARLVDGAAAAAQQARSFSGEGDQIAILISCIGRKLLMGQYIDDEVEMVSSVLGEHTPAIGFYSYGEISPHETSGKCSLHNQTMTITTLSEKKKTA